jgi:hypothetical protein
MAVWAFVLSLTPPLVWLVWISLSSAFGSGQDPSAAIGPLVGLASFLGIFYFIGPVAGIALGFAARRDQAVNQASRNLALAAVVIGFATLGLYLVVVLVILYAIATCASACAIPASASSMVPCATLTARRGGRPGTWRDAFAHHPRLPVFDPDVYRVAGLRLCVGCFTAGPVFLLAFVAARLWSVPAAVAWPAGLLLGLAQLLSTLGWTTTKARKIAVKAALGVGAALLLNQVLAAPWPQPVKSFVVAAGGLLALSSTWPRAERMQRLASAG